MLSLIMILLGACVLGLGLFLVIFRRRLGIGVLVAIIGVAIGLAGYWNSGDEGNTGDDGPSSAPTPTLTSIMPADPTQDATHMWANRHEFD